MSINSASYRIAQKELGLFFSSPMAYLFLASFVAVTLFVFFWVDAFFARNIADVRPMFEWMPLLLIFLSAALTMRMWSEEHRNGTIEQVMTLPNSPWSFVLGKFYACVILLAAALALTLPLPMTVAWLADLDTGPVVAGYLATWLMGAAYLSVGLFVSARTNNQIVSLILTVAICSAFYLTGSDALTNLLGYQAAEWLKAFSPAARFDSISRGVLDFRDLYYYLSFVLIFLALNRFALEQLRWADDGDKGHHNFWKGLTLLIVLNAFVANFWLTPLHQLRVDLTQGKLYSISDVTEQQLTQLQEPLLIRGYFSAKTHPLLSPLVPQLQDLMKEYQQVGGQQVRVEIIDPQKEPELEEEAARKFGIQPVPFQVADRYQAALVNSYFHVLVQYGDQHQVLSFRDLIEVKSEPQRELQVKLRNPEFDLTQAIKKVLEDYQSAGDLYAALNKPVKFVGYISNESKLPESLKAFKTQVQQKLETIAKENNKFSYEINEPEANGGQLAKAIQQDFGFRPMVTNLMSSDRFYFYLTLQQGNSLVQLSLPSELNADQFEQSLESGLKRFASGMMKKVAWHAPQPSGYGNASPGFNQLRQLLSDAKVVEDADLESGRVSDDTDLLMVLAPDSLSDNQLFAIDQFLMKGGTVVMNTSPYRSDYQGNRLSAARVDSGLEDWLAHHGLNLGQTMVMDPNNAAFPVPIQRNVGGFTINEMAMLDYPYFADIRGEGLNPDVAFTGSVPQVTVPWSSPIELDDQKLENLKVSKLIMSSENSWLSSDLNILPRMSRNGQSAFTPTGQRDSHLLGVMVEGQFDSFFKGKPSPMMEQANEENETEKEEDSKPDEVVESVLERSSNSARLILFASNDFASDQVLSMLGSVDGSNYQLPAQLLVNAVDWSVEDSSLFSIRSGGHFNRTLPPLEESEQQWIEGMNYVLALLGLLLVWFIRYSLVRKRLTRYQTLFTQVKGA